MIYATGDLHGNALRFQPEYFPEQYEMTKDDYMIVCGDFGFIWNGDKSDDAQLGNSTFETLFSPLHPLASAHNKQMANRIEIFRFIVRSPFYCSKMLKIKLKSF